jgi:hypothetical protein
MTSPVRSGVRYLGNSIEHHRAFVGLVEGQRLQDHNSTSLALRFLLGSNAQDQAESESAESRQSIPAQDGESRQ